MQFSSETGDERGSGTLMLHLLGRCNLECHHCYMDGSPRREEQLRLGRVLDAIGECRELGVGTLYLTGGEPLLYRGLGKIIRTAAEAPSLDIALCTNGTTVTESWSSLFAEAGLRVNISIDGDAEFHDSFRGQAGAFRRSERAVGMLAAAGVQVTVITTISQANLHMVPAIVEWTARSGAAKLLAQPLLKLGRGVGIADQRLSTYQLNRLILQLSDLANGLRDRLDCKIIGASPRFLKAHPCGAYVCNGGGCHRRVEREIKKLVVREDGTVLPEVPNLSPRFSLGNFEDAPLTTLVSRYFEHGYERFDHLCRTAYAEVLPEWDAPILPWEQIIADRSQDWEEGLPASVGAMGCGSCSTVESPGIGSEAGSCWAV